MFSLVIITLIFSEIYSLRSISANIFSGHSHFLKLCKCDKIITREPYFCIFVLCFIFIIIFNFWYDNHTIFSFPFTSTGSSLLSPLLFQIQGLFFFVIYLCMCIPKYINPDCLVCVMKPVHMWSQDWPLDTG